MVTPILPLVQRFPALAALPRWPCVDGPTPVEPLPLPGIPDGELWVKRDDRSCSLYGGNKPRKLEGILGVARIRGSRRLLTAGALGTHHGLATARLGGAAGFATTVVLVDQPWSPAVASQLRRLAASGAEIRYAPGVPGATLQLARAWVRATGRRERPFWVPVGGSSPEGVVGFVSAAFELAEQIEAGRCPPIAEIHVAVGSGGTLAGLVLGTRLAGLPCRIVGVVVTDRLAPSPKRLARLARRTNAWLRRFDPRLPRIAVDPGDFALSHAQLGPGYGTPTPEALAVQRAAARAGLAVETTYTAKCLAESRTRIVAGLVNGPVLFWNTFAGPEPETEAGRKDAATRLPRRLRGRLAAEAADSPRSGPVGAPPARRG